MHGELYRDETRVSCPLYIHHVASETPSDTSLALAVMRHHPGAPEFAYHRCSLARWSYNIWDTSFDLAIMPLHRRSLNVLSNHQVPLPPGVRCCQRIDVRVGVCEHSILRLQRQGHQRRVCRPSHLLGSSVITAYDSAPTTTTAHSPFHAQSSFFVFPS